MDKVKTAFQNFGRVIVDPILYLSVTGIILAIATVCSLGSGVVADLGTLLSAATNSAVIGNLPVIFAVGLTAGFAKKQKSNAAVFGLISYLMFLYVNNAYLTLTDQLAKAGAMGSVWHWPGNGTGSSSYRCQRLRRRTHRMLLRLAL